MSPFNAWVHLKGMETLKLRVEQHAKSAQLIAEFLENELNVTRVLFPGLDSHPQRALAKKQMTGPGTVVSFDIAGGISEAFKFLNKLDMIDISNNLGDSKSLITHPATTTHQRLSPESRLNVGITDSMVRLSVGLEDPADIMGDLELALKKI
jgi:O-succinylhomoserine sulfhydrylase